MKLAAAAALAHQLFRLDCYVPGDGLTYRYARIQPELAPSRLSKDSMMMRNLVLDSRKSVVFDEIKDPKQSYRVCKIVPTAELFIRENGTQGDLFINYDAYLGLSETERAAMMADAQSLEQVTEAQTDAQIAALGALYRTELRARVLDERPRSRVPSDAAHTPNPR